jgi:hypothetical protein
MKETTDIVQESARQMDRQLQSVMPDTWVGHARLSENVQELSDEQQETVLSHTENIVMDKDLPAEKVALKVIEKLGY